MSQFWKVGLICIIIMWFLVIYWSLRCCFFVFWVDDGLIISGILVGRIMFTSRLEYRIGMYMFTILVD